MFHLREIDLGAGSGNRTRTLSLEGSYDTISPYPLEGVGEVIQQFGEVKGLIAVPRETLTCDLWDSGARAKRSAGI